MTMLRPYWRIGTIACRMTRGDERPPFVVELYDDDVLLSRQEFARHDEAVVVAIKALRDACLPVIVLVDPLRSLRPDEAT
jgi:hypothetical protein